jgi:hypothetical protein
MSTAKRAANTRNSEEQFFEVFFVVVSNWNPSAGVLIAWAQQ